MGLGICAVLSIVVGFGLVGLALADAGLFLPILVAPAGAAAAVALFRCAQPRLAERARRVDSLPAVGAMVAAVGSLVVNLHHAAQHLLIDRDPGAYLNTGRWLATHRSLVFDARVGAFTTVRGLKYKSPAVYGHGRSMHFQFSHLLGVLLAQARWVGGDHLMFALTPIFGAVSIVVFYALACRFVRPVLALVATTALAVNVVQLHFSRDAYSEIVVQLVLLGSLWILGSADLGARRAVFAGILLGTSVAARLDGPLYIAAIPLLVGIVAARRRAAFTPSDDDIRPEIVNRLALAAAAVALLGIVDVGLRVPEYAGHVASRVAGEYVGLIGMSVIAIVLGGRALGWHARLVRHRHLPAIAGAVFSSLLFALWLVRPHVQHLTGKPMAIVGQIQAAHHVAIERGRRYFENALQWHAWYLGPPALAAGIVGIGVLLRETIRRGTVAKWTLVVCFCVVSSIYLWNANITPDQLWVMRRFVPIVIPGLLLYAVVVIDRIARRYSGLGLIPAVALAVLLIAWPVSATLPVRDETTQPGMLDTVTATCRALGPHAAVVVLNGDSQLYRQVPQVLRGFCNVPVATREDTFDNTEFSALARRWRAEGRVLKVFADSPALIRQMVPNARPHIVATATNHHLLDQTLDRPPRHYISRFDAFVIATVPLGSPSG